MTQPAKAQEPSMEEILASIRRIIADDDAAKTPAAAPEPPPVPPPRIVASAPPPPPPPAPPPPEVPEEPVVNEALLDEMLAEIVATPIPESAADDLAADVLDLTEAMAAGPETPGFRTINGEPDVVFEDSPPEPPPPPRPSSLDGLRFQDRSERPLMSATTTAAVDSAFHTLAHTVLVQNARTLEDLVKEMLQPLLKSWLDDNLPGLVERLVRAEIDRVSRGRP
jgi:cell pole-organizing protein PopZ